MIKHLVNGEIILHNERHPEKFPKFHRKEKRDVGEVPRRRTVGVKRQESILASNQFPKFCPQPRIPREIHRIK